jgi:hypothetical protein
MFNRWNIRKPPKGLTWAAGITSQLVATLISHPASQNKGFLTGGPLDGRN